MKKTIAFISLAAAVLAACNKQEANPTPEVHYLKASSADETKTSLEFGESLVKVLWSSNDKLAIFSDNSEMYEYTLSAGANSTSGTFSHTGDVDFKGDQSFTAIFPSSMKTSKSANPVWPSSQFRPIYHPEVIGVPMYGIGTFDEQHNPSQVSLHNLGGVLRIRAYNPLGNKIIKKVVIGSTEPMSGDFNVVGVAGGSGFKASVIDNQNAKRYIELDCEGNQGNGVDCDNKETHDFIFAVPESDNDGYANFSISFYDVHGQLITRKTLSSGGLIIKTNKVTTINVNLDTPHYFSVSGTKKVVFAPFTLSHYNGILSFGNVDNSFFWSSDLNIASANTYNDESRSTSDVLFTNTSGNLSVCGSAWEALTYAEWEYLLSRTFTNDVSGIAYSNDGVTIYPDDYDGTSEAGKVFLRYNQDAVQTKAGIYWTADAYDRNAATNDSQRDQAVAIQFMYSNNTGSWSKAVVNRSNKHCIRLVQEIQ